MPFYSYQHPKTKKVVTIFQGMTDVHEYFEKGVKFDRVWECPNAHVEVGSSDISSSQEFAAKTHKKDTIGSVLDRAQDLSEQRKAKNGGKDPIQQKWFKDYAKKRAGKRHPLDKD